MVLARVIFFFFIFFFCRAHMGRCHAGGAGAALLVLQTSRYGYAMVCALALPF
jgi:hypothetical protein